MLELNSRALVILFTFVATGCQAPNGNGGVLCYVFSRIGPVAEEIVADSWLVVRNGKIAKTGAGLEADVVFFHKDVAANVGDAREVAYVVNNGAE